ncbi:DMT family transporter [Galbitalea soli]|uniref:DMT family transporter n=1 Tax=Galbitalea soli TaxID=1268042 RepID=A0A7C9PL23_9MICO|nr:DMT family transporter [Galbitalea soli]NEM89769.1 DMT family transporter [Galbitalea soli]NYJ30471.1 drug/metabolite transporter (DMT)-like permease [Galbitalea soli]
MVLVVVLSLSAALVYGASDFLGGAAAKRLNVVSATTLNYALAAVVILLALPFVGGRWSGGAVSSGAIGGVLAIVGLLAFYAVLAIGPMSLLSPLIALIQATVPIAIAAFSGQGLSALAWVAIGVAVIAIVLISPPRVEGTVRITPRAAVLAVFSGIALGFSLVALDAAPIDSGIVPALWEIIVGLGVLAILLAGLRLTRGRLSGPLVETAARDHAPGSARRAWLASAASGALLGAANCFIVIALHLGDLAVVAVLITTYPVATVVLAATVFRERIAPVQVVGIVLVIAAALLLSAV